MIFKKKLVLKKSADNKKHEELPRGKKLIMSIMPPYTIISIIAIINSACWEIFHAFVVLC